MSKAKKLFVSLVALLLAASVCVFAFASCSEDVTGEIVDTSGTSGTAGTSGKSGISGISFSFDALTAKEGDRIDLKPEVKLSDGGVYNNTMKGLVWESSDPDVVSVAPGGILDAVSYGDAVVTCRSEDNSSICASVNIRVNRDDKLRVGVKKDVYNFGYYTNYMEFEGMEIDLADRIAYELYFNDVEYIPLEAGQREDALNNGLAEREAEKAALEEEESQDAAEDDGNGRNADNPDVAENQNLVSPYAADEEEGAEGAEGAEVAEDADEGDEYKAVDCVIATYSVTAERAMQVCFSSTYYTDYVQVMVRRDFANKFSSDYGLTMNGMFAYLNLDESLSDEEREFKVGTVNGTTAYQAFKTAATMFRYNYDDGTSAVIDPNFSQAVEEEEGYYDEYTNVANDLLDGNIDGFCGDHSILNGYATSGTVFLDDAFSPQDYAVGTAMGSGLTDPINDLIDKWLTIEDCVDSEGNSCTYIEWLMEKWGIETFEAEEEE